MALHNLAAELCAPHTPHTNISALRLCMWLVCTHSQKGGNGLESNHEHSRARSKSSKGGHQSVGGQDSGADQQKRCRHTPLYDTPPGARAGREIAAKLARSIAARVADSVEADRNALIPGEREGGGRLKLSLKRPTPRCWRSGRFHVHNYKPR